MNIYQILMIVGIASNLIKKDIPNDVGSIEKVYRDMSNDDCIGKCQWSRVSSTQLKFDGAIKPGSEKEFNEKISADVKEIILNSGGGSVRIALSIASEIERRKLNVTVDGFCISSCANYLFMAGKIKKINGVVGFHGSAGALDNYNCGDVKSKNACDLIKTEQQFFSRLGVSTKLFDITQSDGKGMNNDNVYAYYAPSKHVMLSLGIKNIIGEQNRNFLDQLNKKFEQTGFIQYRVATDPNPAILKLISGN